MSESFPVITIDGLVASGKGAVAGIVAAQLGLTQLRPFNFFRLLAGESLKGANTAALVRQADSIHHQHLVTPLEDPQLLTPAVTRAAGALANDGRYDPYLINLARGAAYHQRGRGPGLIATGRAMGSAVFSRGEQDADLKIFLTAPTDDRVTEMAGRRDPQDGPADPWPIRRELDRQDNADIRRHFMAVIVPKGAVRIDRGRNNANAVAQQVVRLCETRLPTAFPATGASQRG